MTDINQEENRSLVTDSEATLIEETAQEQSVALEELASNIGQPKEASEAKGYKKYLTIAGNCSRAIQCCFAPCGGGPITTIEEGYVGLRLEFGKLQSKLKPGLHSYNPCTEKIVKVDMRTQIIDVGLQTLLTKDSVTVFVDAFVNYSVVDPIKAIYMVQSYSRMITFFTQGVMKNIISQHTLTDFLSHRKEIESKLAQMIDKQTIAYGLKVYSIETQKIQLPKTMDRAMAISAETQRQADAKLIEAQGNLRSAKIFRQSADELSKNDLSIQLHYFDTLKMIAAEKNSTIIVPDSILNSLKLKKKSSPNA